MFVPERPSNLSTVSTVSAAAAPENLKCALWPGSNPWATLENPSLQLSCQAIKSSGSALPMTMDALL